MAKTTEQRRRQRRRKVQKKKATDANVKETLVISDTEVVEWCWFTKSEYLEACLLIADKYAYVGETAASKSEFRLKVETEADLFWTDAMNKHHTHFLKQGMRPACAPRVGDTIVVEGAVRFRIWRDHMRREHPMLALIPPQRTELANGRTDRLLMDLA